ncbi:hypothetical protein RIF29_39713 [Crotalaria pallida]|uniref:Uncharacterized protein n=1 Tax=Crotalaria pallida TaxID=3830 RepID=A0AAN9E285_CROPI
MKAKNDNENENEDLCLLASETSHKQATVSDDDDVHLSPSIPTPSSLFLNLTPLHTIQYYQQSLKVLLASC